MNKRQRKKAALRYIPKSMRKDFIREATAMYRASDFDILETRFRVVMKTETNNWYLDSQRSETK